MLAPRLLAYISAYEHSYADGDWTRLEPFFTEDAGYEVSGGPPLGGRWEGRDALIAHLGESAESFDGRFDERMLWPRGVPEEMGNIVALPWRGIYRLHRTPDALTIEGTKIATFRTDRIELLRDQLRPGTDRRIESYLRRHHVVH